MLGWQEKVWTYYPSTFAWFEPTFGAPSQYFYGMGNANYDNPTDYTSVNSVISTLTADLAQDYINTQYYATVAASYGLQVVAYEGGPDASGAPSAAAGQVALAAARDPRMETLIQQEYDTWYSAGGGLAMVFDGPYDVITPYNQYAVAEVAQAANPTSSPKYRGLVDLSQASPQPLTGGTVVLPSSVASVPLAKDSYNQGYPTFSVKQPNAWLLSVAVAGTYTLSVQTGSSPTIGQISVALTDTNKIGTYYLGASNTYNLTTLALHAGINTLSIATLSPYSAVAILLTPTASALINDGGFEADQLGSGTSAYAYDPSGTPWSFTGQAGVSGNNSGFTSGNPAAPQGNEVAFVENQGTISQTATNFAAGSYHLNFSMAQRANYNIGTQSFQILIDGTAIGTFTPTSPIYQTVTTASFAVGAGPHTITFKGLNSQGDATDFLDNLSIVQDSSSATTNAAFSDPSFEAISLSTGFSGYAYDPTGSPWSFTGQSGVSGNNSAFTFNNPVAPLGSQVAFLQNQGSFSQTVSSFAAGSYHLSFSVAQRALYATQSFQVLIDGTSIGTFSPLGTTYQTVTTPSFTVGTGPHTITFKGLNASGDATDFLDNMTIVQDTAGVAFSDPGFEAGQLITGSYLYNVTGTPWTFTGQAGVTANSSAFTLNNPAAPQGKEVAFLQNLGTISQSVGGFVAGNYHFTLSAAMRAQYSIQTFQILIDGTAVATFSPTSTSYQTFTSSSFAVSAGTHMITFKGLNSQGDATDFLDNLAIVQDSVGLAFSDPGFEAAQMPNTGFYNYAYDPTGTPWTFANTAGVSGNGSGFTASNPVAPQGVQVGFIQNQGSISQLFTAVPAGSYSISFQLAQRASDKISQTIAILVDGTLLGMFTPAGSTYQLVTTAAFNMTAGSHLITFQGTNGLGDTTAFLDAVTLIPH